MKLTMKLTQPGATLAMRFWTVLSAIGASCGDAHSVGTHDLDASVPGDAHVGDVTDARLVACEQQEEAESAFLAAHSACNVDADCAVLGDCSNAHFVPVSASAAVEGQELIAARCDKVSDGPTFHPVCRASTCQLVFSTLPCGGGGHDKCPAGLTFEAPGCEGEPFPAGCYVACDSETAGSCPPGFTCQETSVTPSCASEGCDACGEMRELCRPAPGCELSLSLTLDEGSVASTHHDQGAELVVKMTNLTEAPLTVSYDASCHGPRVSGLGEFDLWSACLAGACEQELVPTRLALAPGEARVLGRAVVTPGASTCNPSGLADGTYRLSVALENLTGASVCGPSPVELTVLPGMYPF